MVDQHSALRVKLSDIVEGLEFQSDERTSFLNLTTGEASLSPVRNDVLRRTTHPSKTSQSGSMTRFVSRGTLWKRSTISHYPTDLRYMNTASWGVSVSRWMVRTCGMICVTPYVVEERSGVLRIGFRRMGWLRHGTGIVMQHCERLP